MQSGDKTRLCQVKLRRQCYLINPYAFTNAISFVCVISFFNVRALLRFYIFFKWLLMEYFFKNKKKTNKWKNFILLRSNILYPPSLSSKRLKETKLLSCCFGHFFRIYMKIFIVCQGFFQVTLDGRRVL